jgi:hypothetical protein
VLVGLTLVSGTTALVLGSGIEARRDGTRALDDGRFAEAE